MGCSSSSLWPNPVPRIAVQTNRAEATSISSATDEKSARRARAATERPRRLSRLPAGGRPRGGNGRGTALHPHAWNPVVAAGHPSIHAAAATRAPSLSHWIGAKGFS
jgi:hypothetical protein